MADFFHILRRSVSLIVFKSDPEDFEEIHVQQKVRSSVNERKRRHSVNAELCSITTRSFQREGLYEKKRNGTCCCSSPSVHRAAPICRILRKRGKSHACLV
ncbi:hypothetical protein RB195_017207 [Necator americanus]|uniref:Uncharacterized protein n=1 Tax=Necator americanus TaxID=51031 RepID=A0ABR1C676_NECAM